MREVTPKYQVGTEVRFRASGGRRPRRLTGTIVRCESGTAAGVYNIQRPYMRKEVQFHQVFRGISEADITEVITEAPPEVAGPAPGAQVTEANNEAKEEPTMAQEGKRGCGYRKVGSMYLVGGFIGVPCDRLPYPLDVCPTCGAGIKVSRGFTEINPANLFGQHEDCKDNHACWLCTPDNAAAFIMLVGEKYYPMPEDFTSEAVNMGISKKIPFVPNSLKVGETVVYLAHHKACQLDVAKAALETAEPVPGTFAVYRTADGKYHANKMANDEKIAKLKEFREQPESPTVWIVPADTRREAKRLVKRMLKDRHQLGIFAAFVPHRVEKLIWESEATPEALEDLEKRGITPVIIKDGDKDHA